MFIFRGDLFYVLPCVILFLCFSVLLALLLPRLLEERANFSAFRTFVRFVPVWFCLFPLPLGVREGLRRFLRFACSCLVLVFFGSSSIAITSLGEERAKFSAFRALVRFALV